MKITDVVLKESEESDELVAEFLGYLDHHNYWEAFNSLIGAYDTNADCLQVWHSDVQAVKSEVIKGLLHVIKHEPDLPVDAIIADMYADLKWPELLTIQKAMQHNKQPVAEESDADPMIGYIQDMYSDLKSGFAGMTVLQLRDYIYDTGSAENLANSIKQIQPELPALINQHKTDIVKNMLEIIKKDYNQSQRVLLPVFLVLNHLGIHWPEIARIKAGLTHGKPNKQANESELTETLKTDGYGGWISPTGKVDYVGEHEHEEWMEDNHGLGYDQAFEQNWVRFATQDTNDLYLQGTLSALKKVYSRYAGNIARTQSIFVDIVNPAGLGPQYKETWDAFHFWSNPKDKSRFMKMFGPETVSAMAESDDDNNMGREQLQRMAANHIISAIQNKSWMSLLDTTQTIEQQQWSLDSRYRFPEKLAQYKTDIVKTILQAVKDPRWFNPDLLVAVKGLKRTGVNWPELDTIISGLQHGKEKIGESAELIPAAEILKYVKQIHPEGEFNIDHVITDHPFWQEADVPVSSLHIFDPEKDDIYDPYNRVQDTNLHHVDRLIPNIAAILQKKPLVIDDAGYILDGNHRALAAEKAGLQTVPVWQPVKGQQGVAESVSENTDDLLEFQLDELAAWHGSFLPRIGKFKPFSHFGSEQAARERLEWMAANDTRFKGQHTGFLYRLDLGITAPAKVKDYPNLQDISTGSVAKIEKWCNDIANDPRAKAYREDIKEQVRLDQKTQQPVYRIKTYSGSHLLRVFGYNTIWGHWHEWGVTNQQRIAQFVTLLKKMGIDGLVYKNQVEHKGELSYIAFDASSVRVIGRAKPVDLSKFVTRVKKPGIKVKPKFSKFIKDPTTKPNAVTVTDLSDVAESNVFTNARMNAIKAGKDTFVVHGKTYKVTGDTTDERQAEITEDITATDIARYVQFTDKKLSDNLRNLFLWVIEINAERRMSDPEFRSQVLAVFDKRKPEILHYMLRYIKHSDADNIKWLTPAMIKMGIDWPELKTINQALNAKNPDRAVTENDDRYNDARKQKSEHDARLVSSALEKIRKHITADNAPTVREITSFWDTIYDINVFSGYRMDILQPILEHHKKTIMYMMLYILKHHDMDDPMDEIFTSLRHARIDWPELKTIQQALAQGKKKESVEEEYGSAMTLQALRTRMNKLMNDDQKYTDPTQRTNWQDGVWRFINSNQAAIFADKGNAGNGDYPAAPYAAWLLVQHMDAHPERQSQFYMKLRKAFPNHPKLQFLKDRSAVNAWILRNANNPEYYVNGKPLPDPTVNVRNPALFKDASVKAASREEALTNAEQAGNKLLVAAVKATNAQTQPSYTQQNESVEEADHSEGFKILSDIMMRDYADNKVRGFWYMLYHLNDWDMTVDQFPEFDHLIAEIKPEIIKSLLKAIRADSDGEAISNVLHSIDRMHKCGVNWPELNQIKSGLEHNRETEPLDENKYKQAEAETAARQVSAKLEKASKLIGNPSYDNHKMTFWEALWTISTIGPGYRQIFTPILNHYKPSIMLHILKLAKAGNTEAVERATEILNNTHIQWPELTTIHKALTHGKQQTTEGMDDITSYRLQNFVKQIQQPLKQQVGWQAAQALEDLANAMISTMYGDNRFTDQDYAEAAAILDLNSYKDLLIRGILENIKQNIKNGDSTNWMATNLAAQKQILIKLGCNWSEMDRIASAVAHNAN